jgi:hypothetical protein
MARELGVGEAATTRNVVVLIVRVGGDRKGSRSGPNSESHVITELEAESET